MNCSNLSNLQQIDIFYRHIYDYILYPLMKSIEFATTPTFEKILDCRFIIISASVHFYFGYFSLCILFFATVFFLNKKIEKHLVIFPVAQHSY